MGNDFDNDDFAGNFTEAMLRILIFMGIILFLIKPTAGTFLYFFLPLSSLSTTLKLKRKNKK